MAIDNAHRHNVFGASEIETSRDDLIIAPMSEEMVPQVSLLHLEAFAGYMNTRLGIAYLTAFISWFCNAEQRIALVATDRNGKLMGYAIGAPLGYEKFMNRDLFMVAASGMIRKPWLFLNPQIRRRVMARLRVILGFSLPGPQPKLPEPTMSLVAIGVSPVVRGKKVGHRLLQAFEARAYQLQMKSLRLSVYADNVIAQRLYKSCGWQLFTPSMGEKDVIFYFRVLSGEICWSEKATI